MSSSAPDHSTRGTLDSLAGASVEEAISLTGEVIGGILEVGPLLGKGGMGVVYQVFHREWNRQLAMKLPLAIGEQESFDLKRWVREAHTWIDLGLHPRVVSCWFVRQWKGVPILFLDLFSGGSLKERLEKREHPPQTPEEWGEAITWLVHTCEGLQHAHQTGLVHRDIKPANLLFDSEGHLAVTDFGLGKAINKSESFTGSPLAVMQQSAEMSHLESSLTRTGVMSGTPHYAPPEQWMQKQVGPQADIYALAIVAYEIFTGRHPFEPPGERWTLGQLISAHLMAKPEPPQKYNPDLPTQLSEMLVACLGKKSTDRPQTLAEIREVLLAAFKERTGRDYAFGMPQPLSQRADALNNKAVSLWSIGLREEAVQAWGEADRLERNHLEVTYNRMVTSWLTGRRSAEEAEAEIRGLATVSARGRASSGLFMLTRGKFLAAVSLLEESLASALLSEDGTLWRGLGEAFAAVGEKDKAVEAFEKALALIPTDQFSKTSLQVLKEKDKLSPEGVLAHREWKARGKLTTWALVEDSQALVLLFGRYLVVSDRQGKERVCLEIPLKTTTPFLLTRESHILLVDGQQSWSMSLSREGLEWKLLGLKSWQQRVLGFVTPDAILVGDTTLQLRSREDQSAQGTLLVGNEKQVLCFCVSEDAQRLITGGADRIVRLWSLRDGQCQVEGRGHQNFVSALALGSQEQLMVSGDRKGLVILWLLPKMEKLHRFEFPGSVHQLVLKGEGRDQVLFVDYRPEDDDTRTAVIFIDRLQVVFDRPGRFFHWGPGFGIWDDRGYRLFGLPEGVEWRTEALAGGLTDVVYQAGRNEAFFWTESGDFYLHRFPDRLPEAPALSLVRANTLSEVQQARQQYASLMEAAWASYRAEDWKEAYWQLSRARLVEGYSREPETLEFLSRLAKRLQRRELREMWRVRELNAPGQVRSNRVAIDYKGAWAATSSGHIIRLWELKNGTCIRGLTGHRDEILHLQFWEGGIGFGAAPLLLSLGMDRTARLWNPNSGDCIQKFVASDSGILSVGVNEEVCRFAFVNRGGELRLCEWGREQPFEMEVLASCAYEGVPHQVDLSDDGLRVVVGGEKSRVFVYSEEDKELKAEGDVDHNIGLPLPEQRYIGAHARGYLDIHDLSKGKSVGEIPGEISKVTCMTRPKDGGVVATLDARDTLRFWLVEPRLCVLDRPLGERLKSVLFSGNGRYLAGLSDQGSLLIWELEWQLDPSKPRGGDKSVEPEEEPETLTLWQRIKKFFGF